MLKSQAQAQLKRLLRYRLMATDVHIVREAHAYGQPVYMVRNKMDIVSTSAKTLLLWRIFQKMANYFLLLMAPKNRPYNLECEGKTPKDPSAICSGQVLLVSLPTTCKYNET